MIQLQRKIQKQLHLQNNAVQKPERNRGVH
ncbi:unnamed protein product [Brugia pahangi]|uniref:Uncharacterized protein n=1 Tax=Brugia pahangi TaxID=6280 RepID=A0A0N4THL1_BRUPA|nr:unnamed protein product [Brugia pahangi]